MSSELLQAALPVLTKPGRLEWVAGMMDARAKDKAATLGLAVALVAELMRDEVESAADGMGRIVELLELDKSDKKED